MRDLRLAITLTSILSLSLLFAGCGGDSSNDESADSAEGDTVGAEIAEDFNKQMDKARDVEKILQDSKEEIDAAVEDTDGGVKD